MPPVAPGASTYPIISSRPTPETPAEGATVTADIPAQSFEAELLKPQAAQAQIEFSREDAASFPSMSDALGRVIVDATGFELDRQMPQAHHRRLAHVWPDGTGQPERGICLR